MGSWIPVICLFVAGLLVAMSAAPRSHEAPRVETCGPHVSR